MRSYEDSIKSFVIPYIVIVVSYIIIHKIGNFNEGYGFISAIILAFFYFIVGIILYFVFINKNSEFAKGVLCGVLSVFIFLFTIGGCGVFR